MASIVVPASQTSPPLFGPLGISIPKGNIVTGILVTITGSENVAGGVLSASLTGNSTPIAGKIFTLPMAPGGVSLGSVSDLWGPNAWDLSEIANMGIKVVAGNPTGSSITFTITDVLALVYFGMPGPAKLVCCPICRYIQNVYQPPSLIMDTSISPLIYG